jgi:hypothetical protein
LLNNSEIVQFLSCTFESTNGNKAFAKRLHWGCLSVGVIMHSLWEAWVDKIASS